MNEKIMSTFQPESLRKVKSLSPSLYSALLDCKAKASWLAHGDRKRVPQHPKALLGSCFHYVVEMAHSGKVQGESVQERSTSARNLFDKHFKELYEDAHPLLREKFNSFEKIPFFYLFRERAVIESLAVGGKIIGVKTSADEKRSKPTKYIEHTLKSKDGLLQGRPDFIDSDAGEIIDYKTGSVLENSASSMSESEKRQLRFYVCLALENDIQVTKGTIQRESGNFVPMEISEIEARAEGENARENLKNFNSFEGRSFAEAATPSSGNCKFCPCIPFCNAFWRAVTSSWSSDCGTHLEGKILEINESIVQGVKLITLKLEVLLGTVTAKEVFIEQIPKSWVMLGETEMMRVGSSLRIVNGHITSQENPVVLRVDRTMTSIWRIPS